MSSFNLSSYLAKTKVATLLPNDTSGAVPTGGSWVPNGSGLGQGIQITEGAEESSKKPIADIIGEILVAAKDSDPQAIQNAAKKAINAEVPEEFTGNRNVLNLITAIGRRADEDPNFVSTNLDTGEKESSLDNLAKELASYMGLDPQELEIKALNSKSEGKGMETEGLTTTAPQMRMAAVGDEAGKEIEKQKEDPTHKRKKSNPFRVLMGYVGKLRDHGMPKREIVKKILRMKNNRWDAETVRKCVDIVTEMNRRKKKKETTDMTMGTLEGKMFAPAFNLSKWEKEAKLDKAPKGADGDFEDRKSIYDLERDPRLMSVTELLMEFIYMVSAKQFVPGAAENNGMGGLPDKRSIRRKLEKVKAELKRRGYDSDQLINLLDVTSGEEEEEQEG